MDDHVKSLLTRKEVASALGVSVQTVTRLIESGKLSGIPVGERFVRIPGESLERYLASQSEGGAK